MKILIGSVIAIVLLIAAAALFISSGSYNISATTPHWNITHWILEEIRDRSTAYHSKGIQPPSLNDSKFVGVGFRQYHAMCRLCHGAPGYSPSEIARGLYPKPPDLGLKNMPQLSDAEIYWVVKNGIKMSGMPAFGPTHNEDELWSVVAFLRRMPGMQAKDYEALVREADQHKKEEDHHHGLRKH